MKKEINLDDFNWDDETTEIIPKKSEIKEIKENSNESDKESNEEEKEKNIEEEFDWDEFEQDEKEHEGVKKNIIKENNISKEVKNKKEITSEVNDDNKSLYTDLFKDLKNNGLFNHVDINEEDDLTEEDFFELQKEDYEKEINSRIEEWVKELDNDAKDFISFKRKGGRTEDFLNYLNKNKTIFLDGDLEDENYQDYLLRDKLQSEGWDDEEIEENLENLKNKGKKLQLAQKHYKKISQEINKERENILRQQEQQQQLAKIREEEYKQELKENLNSNNNFKGFSINNKDKNKIFNFITERAYKTEDNVKLTGFQKSLNEAIRDKEKVVILSHLLMNDFDLSNFEKQVVTKKTKEIKNNLEKRKSLKPIKNNGYEQKSLADFFD